MSIDTRQADGMIRWGCTQCDPELDQHGPWLRISSETLAQVKADEAAHFEKWHVPAVLKPGTIPPIRR